MPRRINSRLRQVRKSRNYLLAWMRTTPRRLVQLNLTNQINPQMKMSMTIQLRKPRRSAENAGNGETTPLKSARQRILMISLQDRMGLIWLPARKLSLLHGESRELIF
jgi:hypothetical protein